MSKKAVILAGGKGRRLEPYTSVLPKPLMPVGGAPILEIILWQLRHFGFDEITLACGHLAELIQAYLLRHPLSGEMKIDYYIESQPRGTAGALRSLDGLDSTFLVMNGDILTSLDYGRLMQAHRESGAALTIAVTQKKIQLALGVLQLDGGHNVVGYDEKPVKSYPASMGIYVYEPRVLDWIRPDEYLDFPTLVMRLVNAGQRVVGYPSDDFWLDIGNKDDFDRAAREFHQRRNELHVERLLPRLDQSIDEGESPP